MADKPVEKRKTCFVVGPIGAAGSPPRTHADWLLEGIIEPTFRESFPDFDVVRSDKITTPGMIDSQMINHLLEAEIVIADMSLHNANAFYEIGIRHMAQKPIVHVFVEGTEIPFDVKSYRAVQFSFSEFRNLTAAKEGLARAVKDSINPDNQVDNPVTRAAGKLNLEQNATPEQEVLIGMIDEVKKRLLNLEKHNLPRSFTERSSSPPMLSVFFRAHFNDDVTTGQKPLVVKKVRVALNALGVTTQTNISNSEIIIVVYSVRPLGQSLIDQIIYAIEGVTGVLSVEQVE